jgi:heme-binding NEAT domain protein
MIIGIEIEIESLATRYDFEVDFDFDFDFEEPRQPDATSKLDSPASIWCPHAI